MQKKQIRRGAILCIAILTVLMIIQSGAAQKGASTTKGSPETGGIGTPGNATAEGGNITYVNLSAVSQTTHWQGFWGQVTGSLALTDAAGNKMFNWSMGTASGNVFISNYSTLTWTGMSAAAAGACDTIIGTGSDSCTNTFNDGTKTFTIGGTSVNNVNMVRTYNAAGTAAWDEGIISDGTSRLLYAATIYNNANTFKNGAADFQAIVPVNGTSTRTYYFWVELA